MKKSKSFILLLLLFVVGTFYFTKAAEETLCKDCGSMLACLEGRDANYGGYKDCDVWYENGGYHCQVSGGYCGNWQ